MKRRRRIHIRILRIDIVAGMLLTAMMVSALVRWPEKTVADVAIPLALLIAFISWRRS